MVSASAQSKACLWVSRLCSSTGGKARHRGQEPPLFSVHRCECIYDLEKSGDECGCWDGQPERSHPPSQDPGQRLNGPLSTSYMTPNPNCWHTNTPTHHWFCSENLAEFHSTCIVPTKRVCRNSTKMGKRMHSEDRIHCFCSISE